MATLSRLTGIQLGRRLIGLLGLYAVAVAVAVADHRPMKEWELDEAMHVMDADGSGQVDYEE
jgi:hypothetical protein